MGVLREHIRKIRRLREVWKELYNDLCKLNLPEETREKIRKMNTAVNSLFLEGELEE